MTSKTKFVTRMVSLVAIVCLVPLANVHAAAPSSRFIVSADQLTVEDTMTGLTWERSVSTGLYSTVEAEAYCASLKLGAFQSGWRVPRKKELRSIVDIRVKSPGPAIDVDAFPSTPAEEFYAVEGRPGFGGASWSVNFKDGTAHVIWGYDGETGRVRCVRGG